MLYMVIERFEDYDMLRVDKRRAQQGGGRP